MISQILSGEISHSRFEPVRHHFKYRVYFFLIDLDELEALNQKVIGFGYNRIRPVAVHDWDYLDHSEGSIREKLFRFLGESRSKSIAKVKLITLARYFHYVFRPATFYMCYNSQGDLIHCVVEVNNTFQERHLYFLDGPYSGEGGKFTAKCPKEFHVSPFNDMQGEYHFTFYIAPDKLDIRISLYRQNRHHFFARICGSARELNSRNLWRVLLVHPIAASLNIPRILYQASILYFLHKAPFYRKPNPSSPNTIRVAPPTIRQKSAAGIVLSHLAKIRFGRLNLIMPNGCIRCLGDSNSAKAIDLHVRNYNVFWRTLMRSDLGFAESYIAGEWECDDLAGLLRHLIDNSEYLGSSNFATTIFGKTLSRLRHMARSNSLKGSKRNIAQHYDLSNSFFKTFLDESMTYSCALFFSGDETLEVAQENKLRSIIRKSGIAKHHHVLEIGCGWGSFAILAARETGCMVTALTLSRAQQEEAEKRIRSSGLQDQIKVLLIDYRQMTDRFDRIISIEMLEAVGHSHFGEYFASLDRLLKPGGIVALQVITIPDQRYEAYRKTVDFIQTHIFPGGQLPALTPLCNAMTKHSRFVIESLSNHNQDYARTLREWHKRFVQNREKVSALGFGRDFQKKWEYYLAYCEAGFSSRMLNLLQIVLKRPGSADLCDPTDH